MISLRARLAQTHLDPVSLIPNARDWALSHASPGPTVQHVLGGTSLLVLQLQSLGVFIRCRLLQGLDGTDRQAMELRLAGHSTIEVDAVRGLDARVLRARLSRLRQRLRERGILGEWL